MHSIVGTITIVNIVPNISPAVIVPAMPIQKVSCNKGKFGWSYYLFIAADTLFVISFFVLGAEFWVKIQALFQYDARVVVDEKGNSATA
jgi:hypothetical protein